MATVINKRDVALQAASPRTATVNLGSTVNVNGTLNGLPVADVITAAYSTGSATENFFTTSTSNPTGGASGDAHFNSSTSVMWFNIGGVWTRGGTVNASEITTGTLAAARIAANSITADKIAAGTITANELAANSVTSAKINVTTLSAIAANLGTVNAGSITGSANIDITGQGTFKGKGTSGYAVEANVPAGTDRGGVMGNANSTTWYAGNFQNTSTSTSARALYATCPNGKAIYCDGDMQVAGNILSSGTLTTGSVSIVGSLSVTSTALVSNLNSDYLDGKSSALYCQVIPTDSGTCTVSGSGFNLNSLVSGVRTRGTSNFVYIESISDRRLKQDIEPEKLGLEFINQLLPVQYRMKDRPKTKHHGFIAQDVQKLIDGDNDSLFQTHDDGIHGVDYMSLIAPLVKAIQELSKQVEELKHGQKKNCNC